MLNNKFINLIFLIVLVNLNHVEFKNNDTLYSPFKIIYEIKHNKTIENNKKLIRL